MVNLPPYGEKTDLPLGCKSQGYKYPNNYLLKGGYAMRRDIHQKGNYLSLHYFSLNIDLTVGGAFLGKTPEVDLAGLGEDASSSPDQQCLSQT